MTALVKFHPYQAKWITDSSRFMAGMFARQSGKTYCSCFKINDQIIKNEANGKIEDWLILSTGARQSREVIRKGIKFFAQIYNAILTDASMDFKMDNGMIIKSEEVIYPGGSRVISLPATPEATRGFSGNVLLDEFAHHADAKAIWKAVFPVISAGYRIIVISTPNGKGNKFYEIMTSSDLAGLWSRHIVDIHTAVRDGLPRNIDELRRALNDDDAWRQEYELEWMDEATSWLSYDLIALCEHPRARQEYYSGRPCYLGVDIGIRNDLYVITVLERDEDNVLWCREIITRKRASFAEQDDLLADTFSRYRVAGCVIDQTGLGEKPTEDAIRKYGGLVRGVIMTQQSKMQLATDGKRVMQDGLLKIPMGDQELRDDLHKSVKVTGANGFPRFVAESDRSGHADRMWSLFMAVSSALAGETFSASDRFTPTAARSLDGAATPYEIRRGLY